METYSILLGTFFIIIKAVVFLVYKHALFKFHYNFPVGIWWQTTYQGWAAGNHQRRVAVCYTDQQVDTAHAAPWTAQGCLQVDSWACYGCPLWDGCQPGQSAHSLLVAHHAQRRSADGSNLSRRSPRSAWKLESMCHHNRAPLNKCCSSIWLAHCLRLLLGTGISCLSGQI